MRAVLRAVLVAVFLVLVAVGGVATGPKASAAPVPGVDPCTIVNPIPIVGDACDVATGAVGGVTDTVKGAVSFATDPLGYVVEKVQNGVVSLAEKGLPQMTEALEPDFSQSWFVQTYTYTWGLAIFVFIVLLIWSLISYARGLIGPDEIIETLIQRPLIFLGGCAFGPLFAATLAKGMTYLTDDIISNKLFGVSSAGALSKKFGKLVESTDMAGLIGGYAVALIVLLFLMVGLLLIFVTFVVMYLTVMVAGALFPLGWAWYTSPKHTDQAMRIPRLIIGVLMSQPLVFLTLGVALLVASNPPGPGSAAGATAGQKTVGVLIALVLGVVGTWMAGLSPFMLAKFAPVLPEGGTPQGASASLPSGGRGGGGPIGGGKGGLFGRSGGGGAGDAGDSMMSSSSIADASGSAGLRAAGSTAAESTASAATEGAELGAEAGGPLAPVTAVAGAAVGAMAGGAEMAGEAAQDAAETAGGAASGAGTEALHAGADAAGGGSGSDAGGLSGGEGGGAGGGESAGSAGGGVDAGAGVSGAGSGLGDAGGSSYADDASSSAGAWNEVPPRDQGPSASDGGSGGSAGGRGIRVGRAAGRASRGTQRAMDELTSAATAQTEHQNRSR